MTKMYILLQHRMMTALDGRRDAGQGVLEYVGMIVVAALVIVAVATVIKGKGIDKAVGNAIDSVLKFK